MSVIDKIEKYARSVRSYGSDWSEGSPYSDGRQKGFEESIKIIQEDPAHTAREKAKQVAEKAPGCRVVHYEAWEPCTDGLGGGFEGWNLEGDCFEEDRYNEAFRVNESAGYLLVSMNEVPEGLRLTPEEIATGCCCYVVPPAK